MHNLAGLLAGLMTTLAGLSINLADWQVWVAIFSLSHILAFVSGLYVANQAWIVRHHGRVPKNPATPGFKGGAGKPRIPRED